MMRIDGEVLFRVLLEEHPLWSIGSLCCLLRYSYAVLGIRIGFVVNGAECLNRSLMNRRKKFESVDLFWFDELSLPLFQINELMCSTTWSPNAMLFVHKYNKVQYNNGTQVQHK